MSESNTNNSQNIQENNNNDNNQNQNPEENQGGFFNNFFVRMIFMTLAFNMFSKILKGSSNAGNQNKNNPNNNNRDINNLQMKNFFLEKNNNLFDIEFYISNKSNLYRNNFLKGNLQPILKFKDLNYSEENINTTEYTKEIEIKFPIEKYRDLLLDFDVNLFDNNSTKRNSTEFIERKSRIEKLYNKK
jgi:hypothetical protein